MNYYLSTAIDRHLSVEHNITFEDTRNQIHVTLPLWFGESHSEIANINFFILLPIV